MLVVDYRRVTSPNVGGFGCDSKSVELFFDYYYRWSMRKHESYQVLRNGRMRPELLAKISSLSPRPLLQNRPDSQPIALMFLVSVIH